MSALYDGAGRFLGKVPSGRPQTLVKNQRDTVQIHKQETRMQYFVTGATGFIGKRLVKKLLARRGSTVQNPLDQLAAGIEQALL